MTELYRLWHRAGLSHLYRAFDAGSASSRPGTCPNANADMFAKNLPEPFYFYWKRLHFPVRIIWTYWELDIDCRAEANTQRLELWTSIMRAKGWSANQVAQWPVAVRSEQGGELQPNLTPLIEMIKHYKPAHLLCFGEPVRHLLQTAALDFDIFSAMGCSVSFLPGAEDMLPDNRQAKLYTWNIMKQICI